MSSKLQTPVKRTAVRPRTPSLTANPTTASTPATTSTPNRRLSTSIPKPAVIPPRTAPRTNQRSSLMLGPSDRRKLAEALEDVPEADTQFVSYITDSLLVRLTGCSDLSQAKYLRISESDAKLKVQMQKTFHLSMKFDVPALSCVFSFFSLQSCPLMSNIIVKPWILSTVY
jgi:hypothetical protein